MPRVVWRVWAAQKNSLQLSTVFPPSPVIHSSCFCFLIPSSQFRDKWPLTQIKATISSCLMAFSYSLVLFPSGKKSLGSLVNTACCLLSSLDLAYLPWGYQWDPSLCPPASDGEGQWRGCGGSSNPAECAGVLFGRQSQKQPQTAWDWCWTSFFHCRSCISDSGYCHLLRAAL